MTGHSKSAACNRYQPFGGVTLTTGYDLTFDMVLYGYCSFLFSYSKEKIHYYLRHTWVYGAKYESDQWGAALQTHCVTLLTERGVTRPLIGRARALHRLL